MEGIKESNRRRITAAEEEIWRKDVQEQIRRMEVLMYSIVDTISALRKDQADIKEILTAYQTVKQSSGWLKGAVVFGASLVAIVKFWDWK
jgi:hypothetical protein